MFLKFSDTLDGGEAKATMDINGNIEDMFYIKSLEATMEKNKTDGKTIGKRATQHKASGWTGSGSMTIYYCTSKFRELALKYAKTGEDCYFKITVTNNDPASPEIGKQTTVLFNCNIDSVILAKIDIESEALDEDIDFTFDDFDILDRFGKPILA